MSTKVDDMLSEAKELYNTLKNHPYVNDITIKNGMSFHDEFHNIYKYVYIYPPDAQFFKDSWIDTSRYFHFSELSLLAVDGHEINAMYGSLQYHEDGDELNNIHHIYMMELLELLGSLAGELPKKEYLNIWKRSGNKWRPYLYKSVLLETHKYKNGNIDYAYKGVNCVRESKWDKVIEKYKAIIEENKKLNNQIVVDSYQKELDDMINKTNIYHISIEDEEYLNYFYTLVS